MNELKPCPFCGGNGQKLDGDDRWTQIGCKRCGAKSSEFMMDWGKAIKSWNTRYYFVDPDSKI